MSHLSNYFSTSTEEKAEKSKSFFTGLSATKDIQECEAKVKKLKKQLTEAETQYTIKRSIGYSKEYEGPKVNPVLKYNNGRSSSSLIFDAITGTQYSEVPEGALVTDLTYKSGSCNVLVGYAYDLGMAITRTIDYLIPSTNNKIILKITSEFLIPLLGGDMEYIYYPSTGSIDERSVKFRYESNYGVDFFPRRTSAKEFLNTMYGINREFKGLDLNQVSYYAYRNKAFETIIKTAPEDCILTLLGKKYDKNTSVPKLLGLQEEYYNMLVKENLLKEFIDLKDYIEYKKRYFEYAHFEKTDAEYVNYLINCKQWKETIEFYGISLRYNEELWKMLLNSYIGMEVTSTDTAELIRENYKFGKFCNYVITESVNQGYSRLDSFVTTLGDYLAICKKYGTKPTLYSSDLNKIHNIVVRNHQIRFTEEQVKEFATKYEGFKDIEIDDNYVITNPKAPQDMQKEGDELNSCLTFYVHKVLKDECMIFFLRLKEKITESLVSVEIRDNAIVQAAGFMNREITEEEQKALEKFAEMKKIEVRI